MADYAYARMKYRFYRTNRRRSPLFAILGSRTTPFAGARFRVYVLPIFYTYPVL